MQTFYGHKAAGTDIDCLANNMVTVSEDKKPIIWKIVEETYMQFNPQEYSQDCVKSQSPNIFATGCQNGDVSLWSLQKTKPLDVNKNSHKNGWVCSLGGIYNSDFLVSGARDGRLKFYFIDVKNIKMKEGFKQSQLINSTA